MGVVNVALQVGVPLSLVKVMSGGVAACENVSWTQPSFRFFSLEAGDVIVIVVVSSSSDLMAISKLTFSWLESCAGGVAPAGAATTARNSEAARLSVPIRLVTGVCLRVR